MPNGESTLLKLIILGGLISVAKVLMDEPTPPLRLIIARVMLGSAVSMVAGVVLIQFPDLNELGLLGIASALGIVGHTVVESLLKRYLQTKTKEADKS